MIIFSRISICLFMLSVSLVLTGCVTPLPPVRPVAATSPTDFLARSRALVQMEGERNKVLNLMREGTVALGMQQVPEAKSAFDEAVTHVMAVYANTPDAAKARKLWYAEGTKSFKGEPYERAMALFYRGLLYYQGDDFDNARACFLSAQLQDAQAEEEQDRADFHVMDWLEAVCDARRGKMDQVEDVMKRLNGTRPVIPPVKADDNVMIVLNLGLGPVKAAEGNQHEKLVIYPRPTGVAGARVTVDGVGFATEWFTDSVSFQATTRGGRAFDFIQGRKAVYKTTGQVAAKAAEIGGAGMIAYGAHEDDKKVMAAGAGVLAAGILTDVVAAQIQTQADIRTWDTLPDAVSIGMGKIAPGQHTIDVAFVDRDRNPIPGMARQQVVTVPPAPARNMVLFFWSHPPQNRYVPIDSAPAQ